MRYIKVLKYFFKKLFILFILFSTSITSGLTQSIDVPNNITNGYYINLPFGGNVNLSDIRYQYIILADELLNVGLKQSDLLKSIGYNFINMNSKSYKGLTIKLKLTNSTILTTWDDIGSTQVYYGTPNISNLGWFTFPFLNNFNWDGKSNILVSICWDNSTTSLGGGIQFSTTSNNGRSIYNGATSGFGCSLNQAYSSINIPISRFEYQRNTLSPTSITANQTTICNGSSTYLTVNGNDGTTYWFTNSCGNSTSSSIGTGNNIIISPTTTTTYFARNYLDGQWSLSCAQITLSVVNPPSIPINITSNSPQCSSVNITRNSSPSSGISWYWQGTNPNGTSTTLGSGTSFNTTSSGTYYIRAKNNIANCWSIQSASISVNVTSPSTPINPSSNSPQCSSVTISRNGTPPSGVTWYWQGTNPDSKMTTLGSGNTYNATSSGTYYIRAKNNTADCWSNLSGSITVNVLGYPDSPINPSSNSPQCSLINITRNGTPPTGITWYWQGMNIDGKMTTLGSGTTYNATSSGTYYIRAKNNIADCWSQQSASVLVKIKSKSDTTFIQTTAIDKFIFNNTTYSENGIYFSRLKNIYGCDSIIALNLIFEKSELIENNYSKLTIYPNPSYNGVFSIGSEENIENLVVIDLNGKIVQHKLNNNYIDISNLSPGIYNLIIELKKQKYSIKIVYLE